MTDTELQLCPDLVRFSFLSSLCHRLTVALDFKLHLDVSFAWVSPGRNNISWKK